MIAPPSPRSVRVAAVQMVSKPDVAANLRDAAALVAEAAAQGARLVGLPEFFCLMGRENDKIAVREADGHGPIQDFLAETAARHRIWLAGGTIPLAAPEPGKVMNSLLVYGPDGARVARYDKIHLFAFATGDEAYDESRTMVPGRAVRSFEMAPADGPGLKVGVSVCSDRRFPELDRTRGKRGVRMGPAAFTATT